MNAPNRRAEAGMTLLEVMLASAIMVLMMVLAWGTISATSNGRKTYLQAGERNHELRVALGRVVADFEAAYLSKNEDQMATHPRTMFVAKSFDDIRFSTLGHRVLWSDANESEQTVISYVTRKDGAKGTTDWVRREQRRPSNDPPDDVPAEYDILMRDIFAVKLEFWNWKNLEWQETWDTTQTDGQRGWLPSRVKITITTRAPNGDEYKVSTQARILMQEPLNFVQ
ncbi:MAG: type II secretion system protein GspJ [Kofleriaceae bacterium]